MKKIKNFFINASKQLQEVFFRFPVTIILVAVATLLIYIQLQFNAFNSDLIERIIVGMITFGFGTIFVESFDNKKSIFSYIGYVVSLLIGIFYFFVFKSTENLEANRFLLARLLAVYGISSMLGTVFVLHKKSRIDFKEYVVRVFSNLLKTSIYYGVFCLGTITIFIIFEMLIFSNGSEVYTNLLFLTFGWCYVPIMINSFVKVEDRIPGFLKGLITFVLYPIAIISTILIYVYFVKIIVLQELLHKSFFAIIAWLFVSSFPMLIISNVISDKGESKILNRIYCIAYIPLVLMEVYSMGIRVLEYSLTSSRYFAFVFVTAQIIILFLLLFKDGKKFNYVLLALIVLTVASVVGPLNFIEVGVKAQEKRLAKALEGVTKIDDIKDRDNVSSIMRYLKEYNDDEFLDKTVPKEIKEELEKDSYYLFDDYEYKYLNQKLSDLNIYDYRRIYYVNGLGDNNDITKVELVEKEKEISVEIDVSSLLNELVRSDGKDKTDFVLETKNPDYDFYFESITFTYNKDTNEIRSLSSISGYLLERIK